MMGPEFPTTNASACSSGFTGWNAAATRRATGSASASWLPLPVSMGLASRWWTTGPASNADFDFRRPRCRELCLGPLAPFCLDSLWVKFQNESDRDAHRKASGTSPNSLSGTPSSVPWPRSDPCRAKGVPSMCDYSLDLVASRPAKVGDELVTTMFENSMTRGFAAIGEPSVAVCLLPGTEVAFEQDVRYERFFAFLPHIKLGTKVARFRQINAGKPRVHHDALEFPDGETVLLTRLCEGQHATVLQLPASPQPVTAAERQRSNSLVR